MPVIKVMVDYESFPLWRRSAAGTANLDPRTLPISNGLASALLRWADAYDATLDKSDPAASGFLEESTEHAFYSKGEELARQLAVELGQGYVVEYFDGRLGDVVAIRQS